MSTVSKVLVLNPFPYIQFPCKVGKRWKWKLEIGDHWGDERWYKWEGGIKNKYQYKITELVSLETALGELRCYKVESSAKSRLGTTYLTAYFNQQYGFVRYEYVNIDGSQINMDLIQITH